MSKLIQYVATLRCIIHSPDEVEAQLAADQLQQTCMELLDEEDGDEVMLTQVTNMSSDVEPEEVVMILQRARNALIRTRIKQCYEQAQELDKIIHHLKLRYDPELSVQYDYGRFFDIATDILTKGADPV